MVVFLAHWTNIVVFVRLVSRSFVSTIFWSESGRLGSKNKQLGSEGLQKPTFHRSWNSDDFSVNFWCFLEALGAVFLTFDVLKTGLKLTIFHGYPQGPPG